MSQVIACRKVFEEVAAQIREAIHKGYGTLTRANAEGRAGGVIEGNGPAADEVPLRAARTRPLRKG